jgi:hypothetical protein
MSNKFLSVIGNVFSEGILIADKLLPFANFFPAFVPMVKIVQTAETDIKFAIREIAVVESIITEQGNGAARLAAAAPRIATLFTNAVDELGLEIADEKAASVALTNITSNLADFLNACQSKKR